MSTADPSPTDAELLERSRLLREKARALIDVSRQTVQWSRDLHALCLRPARDFFALRRRVVGAEQPECVRRAVVRSAPARR